MIVARNKWDEMRWSISRPELLERKELLRLIDGIDPVVPLWINNTLQISVHDMEPPYRFLVAKATWTHSAYWCGTVEETIERVRSIWEGMVYGYEFLQART